MPGGNPKWKKGSPSPNPKGRTPGPTMPTLLLKEAFLMAAQRAGGGGEDGLVNYLERHANKTPAVFIAALSRIIPMQIESNAQGHITIEIVKRFDAEEPKLIEHKANGHANGKHDPAAE
jgi:hypothetical protein